MSRKKREELGKKLDELIEVNRSDWEREALSLPCMDQWVEHPITRAMAPMWICITNLNDHEGWSREQIADWLDRLNDGGLDLSFKEKGDEYVED